MPRFFSTGVDRFQKCNVAFTNKGYEINVITYTNDKHLLAGILLLVRMLLNDKQIALKDMGHDLFERNTPLFLQQPVLFLVPLEVIVHKISQCVPNGNTSQIIRY